MDHAQRGQRAWIWTLRGLVALGLVATAHYFGWWSEGGRIASPLLAVALVAAALYHWTQLLSSWLIYLAARHRRPVNRTHTAEDPTVDVFVTACGEPPELVERALGAVVGLRGRHRSWLLDDGHDPRLADLARRLGAGYLTRGDRRNAKAGNVNAALERTDGEIVVVFDVDHVPAADFLERTVGHFRDPRVGFVQVMLNFSNEREGWFARAAAESCLDFFNPTSIGMDRLRSATLMGSNALIRRRALESIAGYRPGLAEDLATSMSLHAAGWESVYVAEPLAPGLAPSDLGSWLTQQFKWARGVLEVLLTDYPRLFLRLTWAQRLCYAVRMTYYWAGPVTGIHILFTTGVLIGGATVAQVDLREYVSRLLPLMIVAVAIRVVALRCWRHRSVRVSVPMRPAILVHATWPVYTLAWLMALLRVPLRFRATPKTSTGRLRAAWLLPQAGSAALLGVAAAIALARSHPANLDLLLAFCAIQAFPQLWVVWHAARRRRDGGVATDRTLAVGKPLAPAERGCRIPAP